MNYFVCVEVEEHTFHKCVSKRPFFKHSYLKTNAAKINDIFKNYCQVHFLLRLDQNFIRAIPLFSIANFVNPSITGTWYRYCLLSYLIILLFNNLQNVSQLKTLGCYAFSRHLVDSQLECIQFPGRTPSSSNWLKQVVTHK